MNNHKHLFLFLLLFSLAFILPAQSFKLRPTIQENKTYGVDKESHYSVRMERDYGEGGEKDQNPFYKSVSKGLKTTVTTSSLDSFKVNSWIVHVERFFQRQELSTQKPAVSEREIKNVRIYGRKQVTQKLSVDSLGHSLNKPEVSKEEADLILGMIVFETTPHSRELFVGDTLQRWIKNRNPINGEPNPILTIFTLEKIEDDKAFFDLSGVIGLDHQESKGILTMTGHLSGAYVYDIKERLATDFWSKIDATLTAKAGSRTFKGKLMADTKTHVWLAN
ncbi:MAG: hypothetical protein AAFY71_23940 [Bacteroidota bacterium]